MTTVADPGQTREQTREVGRARLRKEDHRLLTGRTRWTDNLNLPGMVHLAMVRSPFAHARITSIDTSQAAQAPGVVGVWTGADLPEQGAMPIAWTVSDDLKVPTLLPLSVGAVKHVGDVVAVVAATSQAEAIDAAELVDVDYEELPVVTDPLAALEEGSPLVHPELGTNVCATWGMDSVTLGTGGDAAEAIAAAEADPDQVVIRRTLRENRVTPGFIEPAPSSSTRPPSRSPCGLPPRSRTSSASCWPCASRSRSTSCGSSPPTSGAASAASCR